MSIKIGINGFGRIGRFVFRAGINCSAIEFPGINDPGMTPDYMAYMLKYDTMHGQFDGEISYTDDSIMVNGKEIKFYTKFNPAEIPWGEPVSYTHLGHDIPHPVLQRIHADRPRAIVNVGVVGKGGLRHAQGV